jgi:hypothetical protein
MAKKIMAAAVTVALVLVSTCFIKPVASQEQKTHPFLRENIKEMVTAEGEKADKDKVFGKKYILLYFASSVYGATGPCENCREFSPKLVSYYRQNKGGEKFELVFISYDFDDDEMLRTMRKWRLPGAAADWRSRTEFGKVLKKSPATKGDSIPRLLLFDENDQILHSSYDTGKYIRPTDKTLKIIDKIINPPVQQ